MSVALQQLKMHLYVMGKRRNMLGSQNWNHQVIFICVRGYMLVQLFSSSSGCLDFVKVGDINAAKYRYPILHLEARDKRI